MNDPVKPAIFIIIGFILFICGGRLGYLNGIDEMQRKAVKSGHAFYTNDVNGDSVLVWKLFKE
jgi:hypothetical protein